MEAVGSVPSSRQPTPHCSAERNNSKKQSKAMQYLIGIRIPRDEGVVGDKQCLCIVYCVVLGIGLTHGGVMSLRPDELWYRSLIDSGSA